MRVPVAGLTPYPGDVRGQPDWAAQVVITPVAMLTLGDTSNGAVKDKYDAAYASVNVNARGGAYGSGMVNSDPMLMLQTGDAAKIGTAVATLVASAKTLDTLTLARSLYECREGGSGRLSNELFNQVRGGACAGIVVLRGRGGTGPACCAAERAEPGARCCTDRLKLARLPHTPPMKPPHPHPCTERSGPRRCSSPTCGTLPPR